ncbi:MAG TPA: response regulator [Thermodesulfobacteriota bacterium]|nr:response regulator [Thermodesulfobacteriota bacterium]
MRKILVVDDEEPLRMLYEEALKREGYEVLTACNGKEALAVLEKAKPDLIVLDIMMPVMNGMEALSPVLGKNRDVPIILHTSFPEFREDFKSWAAEAYITKSPDLTELKSKIRELLEKRERSIP